MQDAKRAEGLLLMARLLVDIGHYVEMMPGFG